MVLTGIKATLRLLLLSRSGKYQLLAALIPRMIVDGIALVFVAQSTPDLALVAMLSGQRLFGCSE